MIIGLTGRLREKQELTGGGNHCAIISEGAPAQILVLIKRCNCAELKKTQNLSFGRDEKKHGIFIVFYLAMIWKCFNEVALRRFNPLRKAASTTNHFFAFTFEFIYIASFISFSPLCD